MPAAENMTEDLLAVMRGRLSDAESAAERLRAAIAVLDSDALALAPAAVTVADSPSEAPRPRRRSRRAPTLPAATVVVPLERLLTVVAEHPAQTTSWLAAHTGGDSHQLLALLKEAEADGEVRRQGQRRGTRWSRFTDEDRIAERVRELETAGREAPATPAE